METIIPNYQLFIICIFILAMCVFFTEEDSSWRNIKLILCFVLACGLLWLIYACSYHKNDFEGMFHPNRLRMFVIQFGPYFPFIGGIYLIVKKFWPRF
jgi:hypothetical protein